MSTITYKCNVCKRKIDKLENTQGLTVFSKCIITDGCKGNLYKIKRDASNIRESFPPIEEGVRDYFPRKLLYAHTQSVPTEEWKVFHDLSSSPAIVVYEAIDGGYRILDQDDYTVTVIDADSLTITFDIQRTGIAHCIARTTVPVSPKLVKPIENPVKVTSNGKLTIAVPEVIVEYPDSSVLTPFNTLDTRVAIKIQTVRPNEEPLECFEELDDGVNTAWIGWDRILVRNRRHYSTEGKSLSNFRAFSDVELDLTEIPNGTLIRFLEIDYNFDNDITDGFQTIPSRGLFILLSKEPYSSVDKIKNKLIDVGEMIKTEYDYFIFNDGELYTGLSNEESTYPDIKNAPGKTPITAIPPTPQITIPLPSATPVLSPTPTPTVTPTNTPTQTVTPTVTPTISVTATVTPTVTPTSTITPTPNITQTVTPNPTVTPTQTITPTVTPTITPTMTITPTQTVTPNPTATPNITPDVTPDPTVTPTLTVTPTITPTQSG